MRPKRTGSLFKQKRSKFWWGRVYTPTGIIRRSLETTNLKEADDKLAEMVQAVRKGKLTVEATKTTVEDLLKMVLQSYVADQSKSLKRKEDGSPRDLYQFTPLRKFFGHMRAREVRAHHLTAYRAERQEAGKAQATVRNELSVLHQGFKLALDAEAVTSIPVFPKFKKLRNARQGFFERADFERVLSHIHRDLHPPLRFAYLTGWRRGEFLPLRWNQVDLEHGTIRLEPGTTKNDEGRNVPFHKLPELDRLMREQRTRVTALEQALKRVIPFVFPRSNGEPILDFRSRWETACEKALIPGKLVHDFRRTAVRNLERAGVSRSVAMKITGHKTESIYRRYAISTQEDIGEGLEKLGRLHEKERKATKNA